MISKATHSEYLVSVIIPCFNCEKYIAQAIESVLNQTFKNLELIIINDGSTDDSEGIIKKYLHQDERIKYHSQINKGVSLTRNEGIELSNGKIIAFLDADDVWEPENLEIKIKALTADPNLYWVFSDIYLIDENNNKTGFIEGGSDVNILSSLLSRKGDIIHAPSNIVLRRECLTNSKIRFDHKLSTSADWDFCIQLEANHFKGKRIAKPLWSYRVLTNSMSRNIQALENDNLLVLKKATASHLFNSFWFRQKCYSNSYLILAGCWWIEGNSIVRGLYFIARSILYYPPNIFKILSKLRNYNFFQARPISINTSESFLKKTLPFKKVKKTTKKNVTVFLFHRVNTIRDRLWNPIQPTHFEEIIAYINKYFEAVPLHDYLLDNYTPVTSKPLCSIGFDDGYKDYLDYALPILEKFNCPSSMYLVTDCIDQNLPPWTYLLNHLFINTAKHSMDLAPDIFPGHLKNMNWRDKEERINYARMLNPFLKSLKNEQRRNIYNQIVSQFNDVEMPYGLMLTWNEVKGLAQHNCEIGSHSVSHPMLSKSLSFDELTRELKDSALTIEKHTGIFPQSISYPFGAYNDLVKEVAAKTGYKIGVIVNPTPYDSSRHDLLEVPRIELFDEPFFKTRLRINQIMPRIKQIISSVS